MNALPTNIDIAKARLPATYEQAKMALASCEKIDECQTWANKAEALASYAKMADDDSLRVLADRIQAQAVRRIGELLKQFDARGGDQGKSEGAHTFASAEPSRQEMADRAGLSKHQQVQAVRVANVPEEKFVVAIEAPKPATVTQLAEMGKKVHGVPEDSFKRATHLIGTVKRFANFCQTNAPETVAAGVLPDEILELRAGMLVIEAWLKLLALDLQEPKAPETATAKPDASNATEREREQRWGETMEQKKGAGRGQRQWRSSGLGAGRCAADDLRGRRLLHPQRRRRGRRLFDRSHHLPRRRQGCRLQRRLLAGRRRMARAWESPRARGAKSLAQQHADKRGPLGESSTAALAPAGDDLDIPDFLRRHAEENGGTEPNAMQAREGAAA
jgi:hypothetical protein